VTNEAGRADRLRAAIYARLEETSFRSGATVGAAALGVAGVVIAITVTLGGHPVAQAQAADGPPASAAPLDPSLAPSPAPTSVPAVASPSAKASAKPKVAAAAAPVPANLPAVRVTPTAPASVARPVTRRPAVPPRWLSPPGYPWFWGPPPGSRPWPYQRPPRPRW